MVFSGRNLWNMRRFYEEYKDKSFLQQLVAEIPWGHNLLIMEKLTGDKEREYYIRSSQRDCPRRSRENFLMSKT
ncbi:MAG: hypothetical protein AYP45_01535 [Candidatus Brocadia carolinensis]|uniref:YhcG N-terminal domain-containing protein n=1 Tax=Candidatus Brocadia carolinensis TaxID=1004156 RepID=A0A1V4AX94_9BACT|nr:MAG: hypothetical protein AYP45_01535 [Candidatus Brocadia caroliniensis]